jgi:hypothetical protein
MTRRKKLDQPVSSETLGALLGWNLEDFEQNQPLQVPFFA